MAIPDNHRLSLPPATAGPDYRFRCRDVTRANNDHKSKGLTASQSNVDFALAQTRDDSRAGRQESWCFHHDAFQRQRCRNISYQLGAKIRNPRVDRAKAVNITVTPGISDRHIRIANAQSSIVEEHHPSIYFQIARFSETSCDFANFRFRMTEGFDFAVARERVGLK